MDFKTWMERYAISTEDYRREIAELEYHEAKAWREYKEAEDADLDGRAKQAHRRQQMFLDRICKLHSRWIRQKVKEQTEAERQRERVGV